MKSALCLVVLLALLAHAASFRTNARAALSFSRQTPLSFYQKAANRFANVKPLKIAQKQNIGQFVPAQYPEANNLLAKAPVAPFSGFRFQQQQQQQQQQHQQHQRVQQHVQQRSRDDGFGVTGAPQASLMDMASFGNGGVLSGFNWNSFQNPYPQPGATGMAGNLLHPLNAMAAAAVDSQASFMPNGPSPMMMNQGPGPADPESAMGMQQINALYPSFFLGGAVKEPYGWEHSSDPHEHFSDGTPYSVHLTKYDKFPEVKKA